MSGKALDPKRNEELRRVVDALVMENFEGNRTAFAKAIGVSSSMVQEFLGGTRGAGARFLSALADYTGRSVDSLLGRPEIDDVRQVRPHRWADALGNHPLWAAMRERLSQWFSDIVLDELEGLALKDGIPEYLDEAQLRRFAEGIAEGLAKKAERERQATEQKK